MLAPKTGNLSWFKCREHDRCICFISWKLCVNSSVLIDSFQLSGYRFQLFSFCYRFQKARITVTDGASNTYTNTKFNIYSCPYSFICRQVALGVLNEVQVVALNISNQPFLPFQFLLSSRCIFLSGEKLPKI